MPKNTLKRISLYLLLILFLLNAYSCAVQNSSPQRRNDSGLNIKTGSVKNLPRSQGSRSTFKEVKAPYRSDQDHHRQERHKHQRDHGENNFLFYLCISIFEDLVNLIFNNP